MEYLKHYQPKNGFTKISTIGDGDLKLTEFGIINLKKDEEYNGKTAKSEVALIILGGKCSISGADFEFKSVGERPDVFSGKPYTVYIPAAGVIKSRL